MNGQVEIKFVGYMHLQQVKVTKVVLKLRRSHLMKKPWR